MVIAQPIPRREDDIGGGGDHQTGLAITITISVVVVVVVGAARRRQVVHPVHCGGGCGRTRGVEDGTISLLMITTRGVTGVVVCPHGDEGNITLTWHLIVQKLKQRPMS